MELSSITHTVLNRTSTGTVNKPIERSSSSAHGRQSLSGTEDTVNISQEGRDKASPYKSFAAVQGATTNQAPENLSQQQLQELRQLKLRDKEVRTHEQAHLSAAGRYARGGPSFTYQKGVDGGSYAIGGEVGIDVAKESSPEATITKMQTIKRAALAPANPSGADKRIAAQANAKESQARQDLLQAQQEKLLQGETTPNSLSSNPLASRDNDPELPASSYSSLKTEMAAYEKIAAG
jgi:hypothetical protein